MEKTLNLLSEKGLRITRTREVMLKAMLKFKSPFSAGDLLEALQRKESGFDMVTVYRNLPVFEEAGLLCRSDFADDMTRYMLSEPGHDHHHHHIICRSCNSIAAIDACMVEAHEKALARMGFREIKHRLEFSGICRACS